MFNHLVMSDFLQPHGLQHDRIPCPSPSLRACSNSCPLSQWCHLVLCHLLLLLPSIFPSIRFFSNESALRIRWPKYWRFSFSISPSNEDSLLIFFTFHFHALEKEMATHSSVLAWRISGMGVPGGLPSMGLHRVRHDWSDLAVAAAFPLGLTLVLFDVQVILESSLTPQFKSISFSVFNLLYVPTLTSIHDYWKNHRFNYMDFCQQSNVSDF